MGEWHLSKYNIISQISPYSIACFNSLRGSYYELNKQEISIFMNFDKVNLNDETIEKFKKLGIIVNFDEQEYLKSSMILTYALRDDIVHFTIATTLACNFNCPYCFEKHYNNSKMSIEIQNKLINFIKKTLIDSKKKRLKIVWFGGEPLLAPDVIENISKEIIPFCDNNNIIYSSSIITNGYLFNQENVDLLNKYKVYSTQITLDGVEEIHDKTRCLLNGKGSFEKIISNLENVKYKGSIDIRNNIHNENKHEVEILKKILKKIEKQSNNIIIYKPAPIINNPGEERENQVNYLTIEDGIDFELERRKNNIPKCKTNFCSANSLYFISIDTEGYLYKCCEDITFKEKSFGHIDTWNCKNPLKTASNIDILTKYINSAGILDNECKDCNFLPICGGDCPSKKFFYNLKCPYTPFKKNPDYFIQKIREIVIKKNEQEKFRTN